MQAEALAAEGARVAVHGRREASAAEFGEGSSLTSTVAEIAAAHGIQALRVLADLTDAEQVAQAVAETEAQLGPIDILVHNAGGDIAADGRKADPNDAVMIAERDWRAILDNNLSSTIYVCQAVAKKMMARGAGGRIITVSSDAAVLAGSNGAQAMYSTAKAGVNHYTKCLAQQLRPHSVNVNCISPGSVASGRVATHTRSGLYGAESARRLAALEEGATTLDRFGSVEECAAVAVFLAGPAGSYVSGEVLKVNGGSAKI